MKLFKNKVGRPSKQTIRNRRIIVFLLVIAVVALSGFCIIAIDKALSGGSIGTRTKNAASVTIEFSNYNTTKPTPGQNVTFKHTVKNAKNKYQIWYLVRDGKVVSKGSCIKIKNATYIENDILTSEKDSAVVKYLKVSIFSDSTCKKQVATKNSTSFSWKTDSSATNKKETIDFYGYNTLEPKLGNKVTFSHVITNAKNKYYIWYLYKKGKVTSKSKCTKINTDSYIEKDALSGEKAKNIEKYLRVSVFSDSKCTNKTASKDSEKIKWGTTYNSSNKTVSIVYYDYNTTTPKRGENVQFKHTIINAKNKYQRWFLVRDNKIVSSNKCTKINTDLYVEKDALALDSQLGVTKYLKVTVYSDSSCTKSVKSRNSISITKNEDQALKLFPTEEEFQEGYMDELSDNYPEKTFCNKNTYNYSQLGYKESIDCIYRSDKKTLNYNDIKVEVINDFNGIDLKINNKKVSISNLYLEEVMFIGDMVIVRTTSSDIRQTRLNIFDSKGKEIYSLNNEFDGGMAINNFSNYYGKSFIIKENYIFINATRLTHGYELVTGSDTDGIELYDDTKDCIKAKQYGDLNITGKYVIEYYGNHEFSKISNLEYTKVKDYKFNDEKIC